MHKQFNNDNGVFNSYIFIRPSGGSRIYRGGGIYFPL